MENTISTLFVANDFEDTEENAAGFNGEMEGGFQEGVENGVTTYPIAEVGGEYYIVSCLEEMRKLIDDYFERTRNHFIANKKTKHFGLSCKLSDDILLYCILLLLVLVQ